MEETPGSSWCNRNLSVFAEPETKDVMNIRYRDLEKEIEVIIILLVTPAT